MKLILFSIKNIMLRGGRTLIIGIFIFFTSFLMLFFYSFIGSVKEKIDNVIIQGITGHIQIRSDKSHEQDMAEVHNKNWSSISILNPEIVKKIKAAVKESFTKDVKLFSLVRYMADIHNNNESKRTLMIGIEPDFENYKDSFKLKKGRYLDPQNLFEILMTEEQAENFKLDINDEVLIKTKDKMGLTTEKKFRVVGIGNFVLISVFSYKACYVGIKSLQHFISMNSDEITDLIFFIPDKNQLKTNINKLKKILMNNHIEFELTSEDKIKSSDIKITGIDLTKFDEVSKKVKISNYTEMGKIFKNINRIIFIIFNILIIIFLIIISLLIMNMIVLISIERFYEIGTLRSIGFSKFHIMIVFILEILLITLFFNSIGLFSGALFIKLINTTGLFPPIPALEIFMGKKLYLILKPIYFFIILIGISSFSLAASFFPILRVSSRNLMEFLKDN